MPRALVCLGILHFGAVSAWAQSTVSDPQQSAATAEIERLLDQKRDMVFEDATLQEFAAFLKNSGIPTHLDERALDEIGIALDTPITFRQHAIRLRDGLGLALNSLDLTWTARNGRLVISSREREEERLLTKVYDVRNLVDLVPVPNWAGGPSGVYRYDFDSLIETIHSTIDPDSWDDYGGPGSIRPFYTRRMRVVVVAQTYEIHRKIQTLLNELAKYGGSKPLPGPSAYELRKPQPASSFKPPATQPFRSSASVRSSQLRTTGQ